MVIVLRRLFLLERETKVYFLVETHVWQMNSNHTRHTYDTKEVGSSHAGSVHPLHNKKKGTDTSAGAVVVTT